MGGKNKWGTCRLCADETLLRESHIVSKFLWQLSGIIKKGESKKFDAVCISDPKLTLRNNQDGFKEFLLCHACEQKRHKLEDAAARKIFRGIRTLDFSNGGNVLQDLNYEETKLFSMFQLWMMGIASHPFFAHVDLGPHERILREMLLAGDPGEPWQYGSTLGVIGGGDEWLTGIMSQPDSIRLRGRRCYRYVIAGVHSFTFVGSHPPVTDEQHLFLQTDGKWPIFPDTIKAHPKLMSQIKSIP